FKSDRRLQPIQSLTATGTTTTGPQRAYRGAYLQRSELDLDGPEEPVIVRLAVARLEPAADAERPAVPVDAQRAGEPRLIAVPHDLDLERVVGHLFELARDRPLHAVGNRRPTQDEQLGVLGRLVAHTASCA